MAGTPHRAAGGLLGGLVGLGGGVPLPLVIGLLGCVAPQAVLDHPKSPGRHPVQQLVVDRSLLC